jgi:peptidyl-prolyl cis-trans isomerase D
MSVIQSIQEKYAKLMAIIIALALIIFVVMLAFENGGNLFRGGNTTSVGKVNGESIDYAAFSKKVDQAERSMEQQGYGLTGDMLQQQAVESAWQQEISQTILDEETGKLGITVGKKELGDMLYGANPPEFLKQQFTDPATGAFNAQLAKTQMDQLLKNTKGNADQMRTREEIIAYINYLQSNRVREKYESLFTNSVNTPKWFIEKENADRSQIASIALVRENYSAINDSTVKVTDEDIKNYITKHKDEEEFKQQVNRSIAYVAFSALPTADDSAAARTKVLDLRAQFDSAHDIKSFLYSQGVQNYYDGHINGSLIQIPVKDSIFKVGVGGIYGPYTDGGNYSLAKIMGVRTQPDTVKFRHILVSTTEVDPKTRQPYPVRDSATARKRADSIMTAIANGSNFDTLAVKLSDDRGKNDQTTGAYTGGIYDDVTAGRMVSEVNDFIFGYPVGKKAVVESEFGFHYIEILSQKGSSSAYKIAYIHRPIEVSEATEAAASNEANQFAGDSRDQKSFDANAEKLKAKGINKNIAADITPTAYNIQGLGSSRSFVKKIYKADLGDVLDPEKVGDNYVVAVVTEINKEGLVSPAKARMRVESILRNKKIAEKLKQKIGTPASLEAAAATLGGKQIEVVDSIRMTGVQIPGPAQTLQYESKVLGASFNPANKGKLAVIEGSSAIYVVRVDNISATPLADANVEEQRKTKDIQGKQQQAQFRNPIDILRRIATIKDRRSEFF